MTITIEHAAIRNFQIRFFFGTGESKLVAPCFSAARDLLSHANDWTNPETWHRMIHR
jgi:hypothetical protein